MPEGSAQFVGAIPEFYHRGLAPVLFHDFADDLVRRAAALGPQDVLELAAGTGVVSSRLAQALGPDARLVVSDLSPAMLALARRNLGGDPRIEFAEIDAMSLPFPDRAFDLALCQFGVMFFPDRPRAYREAARVLRPGGVYLFNTWGPHSANPFAALIQDVVAEFFPEDTPSFYRIPFSCGDPVAVRRDLEAAGWRDVTQETLRQSRLIADPAGFAEAAVNGNPLIAEIRERGGVEPKAVEAAILRRFRDRFGSDPMVMPVETLVFTCRMPPG